MSILEVLEGLRHQGVDEEVAYSVDTTKWGSSPSNSSVVVFDETTMADVTSIVGAPTTSENGNVISLSVLTSLILDHTYRIEVKFTSGGSILECHIRVKAVK